jgi:hypothetical protein
VRHRHEPGVFLGLKQKMGAPDGPTWGFCNNTTGNPKMTTLAKGTSVRRAMRRFLYLIFVAAILGYGVCVAPAAGQSGKAAKRQSGNYGDGEGFRRRGIAERTD